MPRVELLGDDGDFVPEARKALEEIFARFDKDNDKTLSPEELKAFFVACNGSPPSNGTLRELRDTFEHNAKGLTLEGFLDMYNLQTSSDEDETWKDLKKNGYDDQLKLKVAPTTFST